MVERCESLAEILDAALRCLRGVETKHDEALGEEARGSAIKATPTGDSSIVPCEQIRYINCQEIR